jgi:Fe2+ transport system protein B
MKHKRTAHKINFVKLRGIGSLRDRSEVEKLTLKYILKEQDG